LVRRKSCRAEEKERNDRRTSGEEVGGKDPYERKTSEAFGKRSGGDSMYGGRADPP